jgi:hypothetical protein
MEQIKWKPNLGQQTEALSWDVFELMYGGARGGGKTDAGLAWLLYDIENPRYRGLVIRRNADDLKDWIDRARIMYSETGAVFVGQPVEIRFPSGAIVRTGHLNDSNAYMKYQGHEYHRMLIEELTQIPSERMYEMLIASCRSTVDGLKPRIFATTNPDGPGHTWVKERFIEGREANKPFKDEKSGRTRLFVPAKVEDNPVLMEKDPDYVKFLDSLKDPELREQWRHGSWKKARVKGSYYGTQIDALIDQSRVCAIPYDPLLPVHTFWDIGVGDTTPIWFIQVYGKEVRVIDYYENSGEGVKHYIKVLQDKPYKYGRHIAPHDIKVREWGNDAKSRYDVAKENGITFEIAPNVPVMEGIEAVRELLPFCWFDKGKTKDGLNALMHYRKTWIEDRQTFLDQPLHDWASHASDAFRMFAVTFRKLFEKKDSPTTRFSGYKQKV